MDENWVGVGAARELSTVPLRKCRAGKQDIALTYLDSQFGAVHNAYNHVGGPLGEESLENDYLVCPWHQWTFHRITLLGEPGFEDDRVPAFPVEVEDGLVLVNDAIGTSRNKLPMKRTASPAPSCGKLGPSALPESRPRQ